MASAAKPCALRRSTSLPTCVDLPQRSTPSSTMKAPRFVLPLPLPVLSVPVRALRLALVVPEVAVVVVLAVAVISRRGRWCRG